MFLPIWRNFLEVAIRSADPTARRKPMQHLRIEGHHKGKVRLVSVHGHHLTELELLVDNSVSESFGTTADPIHIHVDRITNLLKLMKEDRVKHLTLQMVCVGTPGEGLAALGPEYDCWPVMPNVAIDFPIYQQVSASRLESRDTMRVKGACRMGLNPIYLQHFAQDALKLQGRKQTDAPAANIVTFDMPNHPHDPALLTAQGIASNDQGFTLRRTIMPMRL